MERWLEIALIFTRRDCGQGFEVAVQVALIEKTALQGDCCRFQAGAQQFLGFADPAVQAKGVRGNAGRLFELPQQGVGIALSIVRQLFKGKRLFKVAGKFLFYRLDMGKMAGSFCLRCACPQKYRPDKGGKFVLHGGSSGRKVMRQGHELSVEPVVGK